MQFSPSYYIKKELTEKLKVPSLSKVKSSLGTELADIMFKTCPESLKTELALSPPLKGPGKELWTSPSDILINKVVLKAPLTDRHAKALTHQGILEIGAEIEMRFIEMLNEIKNKELEEQSNMLQWIGNRNKEAAVEEAIQRERERYEAAMMNLDREFQELLFSELRKLEEYLKNMYENILTENTNKLLKDQDMLVRQKVCEALDKEAELMLAKFAEDLKKQEEELHVIFNAKLEVQQEKFNTLFKNEQEVFNIILKQLKHNLQCNNLANLMYMMCIERDRCNKEKIKYKTFFNKKVETLKDEVVKKDRILEKAIAERNEAVNKLNLKNDCLTAVLKQFQKFINYALREVPTQAEFLLDLKNLITFELVDQVVKTGKICPAIMAWKISSSASSSCKDMIVEDFHNCLNEMPVENEEEEVVNDDVPVITFKNRLYIREEFRNKLFNKLKLDSKSKIWNEDVDHLVKLMRQDACTYKKKSSQDKSFPSRCSSVHFPEGEVEKDMSTNKTAQDNVGILAANDSFELLKSCKSEERHSGLIEEYHVSSKGEMTLLAVQDSVELIKEIGKIQSSAPASEERAMLSGKSTDTLHLNTKKKPSIILEEGDNIQLELPSKRSSDISFGRIERSRQSLIPEDDLPEGVSKLSLHRDSVVLTKRKINSKIYTASHNQPDLLSVGGSAKKKVDVNFLHVARLYQELAISDRPWNQKCQWRDAFIASQEPKEKKSKHKLSQPKPPKQNSRPKVDDVKKPTSLQEAKIVGETGEEHLQSSKEFTVNRIHSILDILKKDRSLIKLFIKGTT